MRRFPSMKIGLAGILSCLALLFSLFATTSTASAHSTNDLRPNINVFDVSRFGNCLEFQIAGNGFTPFHHADLSARSFNGGVSINPDRVRVNGNGEFATDAEVCGFGFSEFSSCGDFIDNANFFCGVNLNPKDFCPLSEFGSEPFCLNLSALRPIKPVSKQDQCMDPLLCSQGGNSNQSDNSHSFNQGDNGNQSDNSHSFNQGDNGNQSDNSHPFNQGDNGNPGDNSNPGQGHDQGQQAPPPQCPPFSPGCFPQGQGQDQGQSQDQGSHSGSRCMEDPLLCNQQGQGQPQDQHPHGGSRCELNLELCNPQSQSQGQQGGPRCEEHPELCNPEGQRGGPRCEEHPELCNQFRHPHFFFRFHRVRVFEFCRFNFFSFCHFRFRNQIVTVFIRAFDESTGRRSGTAVIRFGFNF